MTTEKNLRAALGATTSVIDEVKAQNTALADALEWAMGAHPEPGIAVRKSNHQYALDYCAKWDAARAALRAAGRLP